MGTCALGPRIRELLHLHQPKHQQPSILLAVQLPSGLEAPASTTPVHQKVKDNTMQIDDTAVRYIHLRLLDEETGDPLTHGGETVAYAFTPNVADQPRGPGKIVYATAFCHTNDRYCRRKGRLV